MKYQKIINLLELHQINPLNLVQKKINDDARGIITLTVKLNLKSHCEGQVYLIVVMHIYS